MCGGGGGGGDGGAADREAKRRRNLVAGTENIDAALAPFDQNFFDKQGAAFQANALPGLDRSFGDAQRELIFALSRGGILQSNTAGRKQRRLNTERGDFERDIASQAADFANQGKRDVESTRSNLIAQLNATENPSAASASAAREAGLLNNAPSFSPLGNFVFNAADGLNNFSQQRNGGGGFLGASPAGNIRSGGGAGSSRITGA